MNEVLQVFSEQIGMRVSLLLLLIAWTFVWKLIGLWHSARNKDLIWFICIGIFNTLGILPIIYLFIFKDIKNKTPLPKKRKATKKKSTSKNKK